MTARMNFPLTENLVASLVVVLVALACQRTPPPPVEETPVIQSKAASTVSTEAQAAVEPTPSSASAVAASGANRAMSAPTTFAVDSDPMQGKFTLDDATQGLKAKGKIWAEIETDQGRLRCEMFDDKAPLAVANFVGLARGLRPFKDPKTFQWVKRPGYDGTTFHRIIEGFMIQGGDPAGTGAGEPGYVFPDEVWPGATHDKRGLICMANKGPNTNGMQFFILDGEAKHLDRSYTIFGRCSPDSVIEKIAHVEVRVDRAVNPPKIKKVTITRK
jgi:peptidyl-prolyl cis-trans isomerase A (cyclophilin A)